MLHFRRTIKRKLAKVIKVRLFQKSINKIFQKIMLRALVTRIVSLVINIAKKLEKELEIETIQIKVVVVTIVRNQFA